MALQSSTPSKNPGMPRLVDPSTENDREREAEFGFPSRKTDRVSAAAATIALWAKRITFTRCIPAKRSRSRRDEDADLQAHVSEYDKDEDARVYEFAILWRTYCRRTRHRRPNGRETTMNVPPSMAPLEFGSSSSNVPQVSSLREGSADPGSPAMTSGSSILGNGFTGTSASPSQRFSFAEQPGSEPLFGSGSHESGEVRQQWRIPPPQ